MSELHPEIHERRILGSELLWAVGVGILVAATLSTIVFTALTRDINPPSNVERIDPKTLHLATADWAGASLARLAPPATMALVHRDDGDDAALALARPSRSVATGF